MQSAATDFFASGGIWLAVLILLSCIVVLIFLNSIVECFPSLLAATVRWKESENINFAARISRCRTRSCIALTLPFILICSRWHLFEPASDMPALPCIGITAGALAAYLLLRGLLNVLLRSHNMRKDQWESAVRCPRSFFCILTILMTASAAVFQFSGCPDVTAKTILLWEIGALYLLCIIRKTQIFIHYRGVFSGFLYLCTLEIIPSGLLIAADLLL